MLCGAGGRYDMPKVAFEYVYHHLFLPPNLPGADDTSTKCETALLDFVHGSLQRFVFGRSDEKAVRAGASLLDSLRKTRNAQGQLREVAVSEVLQDLSTRPHVAAFGISEQNAGVLIGSDSSSVRFETFELSPTAEAIMSTQGRLVRRFPANAVEIPISEFKNETFRMAISKTMTKMSQQNLRETKDTKETTKTRKPGHDNVHDPVDPAIVTELFASMLRGCGKDVVADAIRKNTREDVVWRNSKLPWRRSSVWLLIRVALQLSMTRLSGDHGNTYKEFMAFLMAEVLHVACHQPKIASDILHVMATKVSRRLWKLENPSDGPWLLSIRDVVSESSQMLEQRWKHIAARAEPPLDLKNLQSSNIREDTRFSLKDLDRFIDSISRRRLATQHRGFRPTLQLDISSQNQLPSLAKNCSEADSPFHLMEIESWVAEKLLIWTDRELERFGNPVSDLRQLIETYHSRAAEHYSRHPEGMSRMILTIGELWHAADVATVHEIPLLRNYSPRIPTVVLQALLLASNHDMRRLQHLEAYIQERDKFAQDLDTPSIFESFGVPNSFAVEFFGTSKPHQHMKYEIEAEAAHKRQEKRDEFRKAKSDYAKLMQKHSASQCDVATRMEDGTSFHIHPASCRRCALETKAKGLAVLIHEWPLPCNELEAQATVFEMTAPSAFIEWRDLTVYFINDVLLSHPKDSSTSRMTYALRNYQPLKSWYRVRRQCRITLRSAAKPNAVIHKRAIPVANSVESDVCLSSGLLYRYFDEKSDFFVTRLVATDRLSKLCTYKLPERARCLDRFLHRSWQNPDGETPNEVIASQDECPHWMSLSEFNTLASLPYGHRIQWMSILTQLAMPRIDFNEPEAAIFLVQMSTQAGPKSSHNNRCTHIWLQDTEFASRLLKDLGTCISRVRENWECYTALWTFTSLATRAVSLASTDLSQRFLDFLQGSREISHRWVGILLQQAEATSDETQRKELLGTALKIALVCTDSFNLYDGFLGQVLQNSTQAAILVECSVIINDNVALTADDPDVFRDVMLHRWKQTMYRARPILIQQNADSKPFLSYAVQRRWRFFKSESPWTESARTNSWFQMIGVRSEVHVNVLSGELLVNGMPLSSLPPDFKSHNDYHRLFKDLSLNVMPSMNPGMTACTSQLFHGYTIHFGKLEQDLLVSLENEESCFDLIPPRLLTRLLPDCFVSDYVHWYDKNTGIIQFRPLSQPFPVEAAKWSVLPNAGSWKLRAEGISVLNPSRGLAQHVSAIMACLESPSNIRVLRDEKKACLRIELPRLELRFSLDDGESAIRSQQYKDMQVDTDQSIGTLVGFKSRLVLRSHDDPHSRLLLIPEGDLNVKRQGGDLTHDHVVVKVQDDTARRVQAYRIDGLLGRLVADTKLESKLYLACLHALTSFCRPDPFLGRLGVGEALGILCSASVRSPTVLSPLARKIIDLLASLAPSRQYYPEDSRMMQTMTWSPHLSFLTQDDRFAKTTSEILRRSSEIGFLYFQPDSPSTSQPCTSMDLARRAISRNASPHAVDYATHDGYADDAEYESRDKINSDRATRATEIAIRAYHGHRGLTQAITGGFAQYLYKLMSTGKLSSRRGAPSKRDLEYDSLWLRRPSAYLASYWCQLHYAFKENQRWLHKMELVVWISTIAYSLEYDEQVTQALLMMALSPSAAAAPLPVGDSHDLSKGYVLQTATIEAAATPYTVSKNVPDGKSRSRTAKGDGKAADRLKREYGKDRRQAVHIFRDRLARQWPCQTPTKPNDYHMESYIDVAQAMKSVLPAWRMWWANMNFKEYLGGVATALKSVPLATVPIEVHFESPRSSKEHHPRRLVIGPSLFCRVAPDPRTIPKPSLDKLVSKRESESEGHDRLTTVIEVLELRTSLQYEHQYLDALRQSLLSLKGHGHNNLTLDDTFTARCQDHIHRCITHHKHVHESLLKASRSLASEPSDSSDVVAAILYQTGFEPAVTPIVLLQQLKGSNWAKLSTDWKDAIMEYGLAIRALQKANRLSRLQNDPVELLRELESGDQEEFIPFRTPEWLLVECESEIMIRPVQRQIAQEMIQPPKGDNAVMQLNMGEGKSSVIVPIVSSALADGSSLVRVIVAKPQAKQMYQTLMHKLSGLLGRQIYQLPISRDVKIDVEHAKTIHSLMVECQKDGGILLVQPEHLLSLQLMELELELKEKAPLSRHLTEIRSFFDECSRDIVDESDENFNVKFELTYTLGQQESIEHSPHRWIVVQEVLGLVCRFCKEAKKEYPRSIEVDDRHAGRFPMIRILRPDVELFIFSRVARHICDTGMPGFSIARQPLKIRNAVQKYITQRDLTSEECQDVENSRFWDASTINHILLLRGLLAGGVLSFAFARKRWRVNYGLDPTREKTTRLAVPYKAKDSPTTRSEFSHPDIAIVLTCLTYYYGGLDDQALIDSLELLIRSDNADLEYQIWIHTAPNLPDSFKDLRGINLKDRIQCTSTIFPHLRYSKGVIDYFLCRMVLNKECKEFPHKLSASGWDLGKKKKRPTTGFSGTNDSRYVLPLDIRQLDLAEQSHTNALVLEHLLQPENSIALMTEEMIGTSFDSQSLLALITTETLKPRVILDVGAQIVDLTNLEIARIWLDHYRSDENTQAAVFFNDRHETMVLDKNGKIEELQTSPFSTQLGQCLVFLDEAHTRGIDLKLPANYQAVVTLGANVTKDKLVQACMRMRKLGKGQSVVLCVQREIEHQIRQLRGDQTTTSPAITVSDVICWAIEETFNDLRRAVPLWLSQGLRFSKHQASWHKFSNQNEQEGRLDCAKQFMENDSQTLTTRYRPRQAGMEDLSLYHHVDLVTAANFRKRCEEFGVTNVRDTSFNEEQERELAPESEQQRQMVLPARVDPAEHLIHSGLADFIVKGASLRDSLIPAFVSLQTTSAAQHLDTSQFPDDVLVTRDFATTVKCKFGPNEHSDAYQRPVHWVLTTRADPNILVVVSPYEVQQLLPAIERSSYVSLHLYSPRVNLAYRPIDDLNVYSLPKSQTRRLMSEQAICSLNLFSGQLYLSSMNQYIHLCHMLGLAWNPAGDEAELGPDGFIPPGLTNGGFANNSQFTKSPVGFLKVLMGKVRSDTEDIEKTHIGRVLSGVRLLSSDLDAEVHQSRT